MKKYSFVVISLIIVLFTSCPTPTKENVAPINNLSLKINNGTSIIAPNKELIITTKLSGFIRGTKEYIWKIDDNEVLRGDSYSSYTFVMNTNVRAEYKLTVIMNTSNGFTSEDSIIITVEPKLLPIQPTINITQDYLNPSLGVPIYLTANTSYDGSIETETYKWYVDGVIDNSSKTNKFNFFKKGSKNVDYNIKCIWNLNGLEYSATKIITITGILSSPSNVQTTPKIESCLITWNAVPDATSYTIIINNELTINTVKTSYLYTPEHISSHNAFYVNIRALNSDDGRGSLFSTRQIGDVLRDPNKKPSTYVSKHYKPREKSYKFTLHTPSYTYAYDDTGNTIEVLSENTSGFNSEGSINMTTHGFNVSGGKIVGNTAFITQHTNTFLALNITDRINPTVISKYTDHIRPNDIKDLTIQNSVAYIPDEGNLVKIIDISNPSSMSLKGSIPINYPNDVKVEGNIVYALGHSSLEIIDISDFKNTRTRSSLSTGGNYLVKNGKYLYILNMWDLSLTIIDKSNPDNPTILSSVNWEAKTIKSGAYGTGLIYDNGKIYILDRVEGIFSIDIRDPSNQILNGIHPVSNNGFDNVNHTNFTLHKNSLYVSCETNGIYVVDTTKLK